LLGRACARINDLRGPRQAKRCGDSCVCYDPGDGVELGCLGCGKRLCRPQSPMIQPCCGLWSDDGNYLDGSDFVWRKKYEPTSCCMAALKCNGMPPKFPKASAKVSATHLNGTWESPICPLAKVMICGAGDGLCGCPCACHFFGPCPFAHHVGCPVSKNCYTDSTCWFITTVDENTIINGACPLFPAIVMNKIQMQAPKLKQMM